MRLRITARSNPPAPASVVRIDPVAVRVHTRPLRVLDFDIENRPLSYLGHDFTTADVTALAWAWADAPEAVTVRLLGETALSDMLDEFLIAYRQADLVTGHYIRGHDLPMLNGALMELRRPPLPDRMTQDTKLDLIRSKGLSLSQESLSAMFRLDHDKVHMTQASWRAANRLLPEGLDLVRGRVVGDVQQHLEMRRELLTHGYLSEPKKWCSGSTRLEAYVP